MDLFQLLASQPIAPYIREGDMAIREPWRTPERRLLDYLLIYIKEGECKFTVDNTPFFFGPGEFCLIQPGSLNELEGLTRTVTPYLHLDLFFNPIREQSFPTRPGQKDLSGYQDLMQPRLNDIPGFNIPVRLVPSHSIKFRENLLKLVELWKENTTYSRLQTVHLSTELIMAVLLDHYQLKPTQRTAQRELDWVPSYMSNHLQEPLSIQTLAERANLSVSRFSAVFKQQFNLSPHQYLLSLRINHAAELLTKTELSQASIAEYCGFANIHHFSKTFKKTKGLSPGAWRTRNLYVTPST